MAASKATKAIIADLNAIVEQLDKRGRLIRVRSEVDPVHELAAIAAKFERGPRAILFERVKGSRFPVFTGLYWSRDLLADIFDCAAAELPRLVSECIHDWQKKPVAPIVVEAGSVMDITEERVDLARLPVPTHAELDGGPYFDAAVVIVKDPETGARNTSIQRFMVVSKNRLAINIDAGRHLEICLNKAAARGKPLPFTLNVGVGPGIHFAAATPAEAAPMGADELGIASRFHGSPLKLVGGTVSNVEMVADAMFALECELVPGELHPEGPFAEVTGYYATVAPRPLVRVKKIHRRRNPIFHTILSGAEVFNSVGLLGEANVLALLQKQVPGVMDVYFSHGGCGFYHGVIKLAQQRAGWAKQALMAAFAAFPPLKIVTVVDEDVDIRNAADVEWAMATRLDPKRGVMVIENVFGHGLNPGFPDYLGSKIGFDATRPFPHTPNYTRAKVKEVDLQGFDIDIPALRRA